MLASLGRMPLSPVLVNVVRALGTFGRTRHGQGDRGSVQVNCPMKVRPKSLAQPARVAPLQEDRPNA